jgi:hypothetical protein
VRHHRRDAPQQRRDQAFVKSAMPEGSRGSLDVIPALRNRECIVCGEAYRLDPRFVRRSRARPPSGFVDPLFSEPGATAAT